jgi:hypothetical protein
MVNNTQNLLDYEIETLAHALYVKGEQMGFPKITDKSKWREPVMAEKLGHKAFEKISAGKNSGKQGADAFESDGRTAEYKTKTIDDNEVRNLTRQIKNIKTGKRFSALVVSGVYNGAYTQEAIDSYTKHNHYFGVFWKEKCVLIIKPNTKFVVETLTKNNNNRKVGATTNCNKVEISLDDISNYETVFKDEKWFEEHK